MPFAAPGFVAESKNVGLTPKLLLPHACDHTNPCTPG